MQIREISSISKEEEGPGPSLFAHYAHSLATPTRTKHSKVAMVQSRTADGLRDSVCVRADADGIVSAASAAGFNRGRSKHGSGRTTCGICNS